MTNGDPAPLLTGFQSLQVANKNYPYIQYCSSQNPFFCSKPLFLSTAISWCQGMRQRSAPQGLDEGGVKALNIELCAVSRLVRDTAQSRRRQANGLFARSVVTEPFAGGRGHSVTVGFSFQTGVSGKRDVALACS